MRRDIYIILTALLSCVFILVSALCFTSSFIRIFESVKDFGLSIAFYFCEIFGIKHAITPTVNDYTHVFDKPAALPSDSQSFVTSGKSYFALLFSADNFSAWGNGVAVWLTKFLMILVIVIPCVIMLVILIRRIYNQPNNRYGIDTTPLRIYKHIVNCTVRPARRFIGGYIDFVRRHRWIWICWLVLWLCSFNLMTIIIEFFAYYFYFAAAFSFSTLYIQFVKLITDLQVFFVYTPAVAIIVAIVLFNRWRRNFAIARLRHMEARNCGFINELPIVSLSCGSMGKKKTTMITDMILSQEVMFRQKALEIMQNADMKFPMFPWIRFEKELQACIEYHTVYNLATVKNWVQIKRRRFENHMNAEWQLYGYDYFRYGLFYNDALKTSDLFDILETYGQAYFIYIVESSLIVSNYSVRTDNAMADGGNLPMWMLDFFTERQGGRHSHILDFDILRLGKKLIAENPAIGSFEFGVIGITEIGKERGNNLELREVKKGTDETNQKNDLFNSWLKMCRHSATVDNFPFIKVFTDEQRPESWGADARDLCDVVRIIDNSEMGLTFPLYTIEDMLSEWAFNGFMHLYMRFRFNRGDNTLLVHILKSITAWLWKRHVRILNRYGYCTLKVETERGTMDGKRNKKKYFLMNGKIYRNRFCTDCFSDYFNELAARSPIGLNDYMEYATEKASVAELREQNSYFINSLYGGGTP